jgi:hypothetical protein
MRWEINETREREKRVQEREKEKVGEGRNEVGERGNRSWVGGIFFGKGGKMELRGEN